MKLLIINLRKMHSVRGISSILIGLIQHFFSTIMRYTRLIVLILSVIAGAGHSLFVYADVNGSNKISEKTAEQRPSTASPANEKTATSNDQLSFEQRLINLTQSIDSSERSKNVLEKKLKRENDDEIKKRLKQEISETEDLIAGMRDEYVNLATNGVKLYARKRSKVNRYDWRADLELIIQPLLDQLKELTERPRKIERLESDIKYWSKREKDLQESVSALKNNSKKVKNKQQIRKLNELLDSAISRHKKASEKLNLLERELEKQINSDSSIWTTVVDGIKTLFVNMGLNLSMALAAALFIYYAVDMLGRVPLFLLDNSNKQYIFAQRSIKLIKNILGALLALLVYVTILYIQAEWVILLLSLALLFACLLGMKGVFPSYLVEIRTLLNLGSVRQGERLIYNGLPWKISLLDVYTQLHNPALDGHLRVPLTELSRLSSRPYHKDEPWFPTKPGDYVRLEDGIFGQVIRQTPEQVQLEFGYAIFYYPCEKFVHSRLQNLSANGFSVTHIFGLDYNLQSIIISVVSVTYHKQFEQYFRQSVYAEQIKSISVEFHAANASSLDFRVIVSMEGSVASDYFIIKRLIQKISVDIANKNGWTIPFQQITVHQGD